MIILLNGRLISPLDDGAKRSIKRSSLYQVGPALGVWLAGTQTIVDLGVSPNVALAAAGVVLIAMTLIRAMAPDTFGPRT